MNTSLKESNSNRMLSSLWLALIVVVFFSPILFTGLFNDDSVLAVLNYRNPDSFLAISNSIGEFINGWLENGRFAPIGGILSETVFHLFDFNHYAGYHVLQLVAISLSCLLFACCLVQGHARRIVAVLLLCAMSANYLHYHDPYISYNLLMPAFTLMFLGAIILFDRYLETGVAGYGVGALALYLLTLSTYEIAYPLVLVFFVQLIKVYPRHRGTWGLLMLLVAAMVGFQLWLRTQAEESVYEGLTLNLSPVTVVHTFVLQAFSSIPLAQQVGKVVLGGIDRFNGFAVEPVLTLTIFIAMTAFAAWSLFRLCRNRTQENALLMIGLIIWLAPPLVVAVSAKYQGELRWGVGYLPRYLQNFGLVLVTIGLAGKFLTMRAGLAALAALLVIVFSLNVRTIRKMNRDFAAARLLYNVVEDPTFLSDLGCTRLFVIKSYMYSCKQYQQINRSVEIHDGASPSEGDHVLLIHPDDAGSEWAILGIFRKGMVLEPRVLRGVRRGALTCISETARFKEWEVSRHGEARASYSELVETVTSDGSCEPGAWARSLQPN